MLWEDIYLESTEAHLQQLETELEKTFSLLLDSDAINTFADGFDFALSSLNNFLGGLGGGVNDFVYFGSLVANIFNNQIGAAIEKQIANFQALKANAEAIDLKQQVINSHAARGEEVINSNAVAIEAEYAEKILNVRKALTAEEYNALTNEQAKIGLLENEVQLSLENYGYLNVEKQENETIEQFNQRRLSLLQEEIAQQETRTQKTREQTEALRGHLDLYKQGLDLNYRNIDIAEDNAQLLRGLRELSRSDLLTKKESVAVFQQIRALRAGENADVQILDTILSRIEQKYNVENKTLEDQKKIRQTILDIVKAEADIENQSDAKARQQAISGTIQGITALTMSLTTISGIVKTLGDESLTAGEKAERVITTLLFSAPMLINNFEAIAGMMPNLAVAMGAVGATTEMSFLEATGAVLTFETALGPLGLVLLGITATIGGIIAISYGLVKAYNADADAAKEAAETAKELKETYESVKQSYDDLKDSLSNYQDARNGLDQLIEGTDEWNEAVQSLNEQVLQLLETYPELAKYVSNTDGLLEISKEGQDALLEAQSQRTQAAYRSSLMGNITSNEAANRSAIHDYRVESNAILSEESIDKVLDAIDTNGLSILENSDALIKATGITELEANAALETKDALIALSDTVQANTESNALYAQQIGQSILEGTKYENSQFGDQLSQLVGQRASDLYTDRYADAYKDKIGGMSDAMIQQQYNDMMGYGGVRNKKDNVGEYLINGEWKEISDSVARAALAQAAAQKMATADIQTYVDAISALTGTTTVENEKVENALANFALKVGDLSNLTKDEVNALAESDFSKLSDDTLKALGFGSVEELETLRNNAVDAWQKNVDSITKDMALSVQDAFANIDTSDLSLAEMKNVADIFALASAYGKLDEAISAYQAGTLEDFAAGIGEVGTSLESLQDQYAAIHKFMDGIKTGDTISAESFAILSEESQKYFVEMLDGTYKLIGSAKEFQEATQQDLIEKFRNQKTDLVNQNAGLSEVSGYDFEKLSQSAVRKDEGSDIPSFSGEIVREQIELIRQLGDQSDATKEKIDAWQQQLSQGTMGVGTLQEIADAVEGCRGQFEGLGDTIQSNNEQIDSMERAITQTYDTIGELEEHIGDFENLDIFNERLLELQNMLDEDIDPEALESLKDAIQDVADSSEGIGTELADNLVEDEEAAEDVAEAILRFDDACVDVADNYEDWMAALNSGDLEEQIAVIDDLRDAYSDLLDIDGFLQNAENLELMRQAIDGDIDAYDELLARAGQDILIQCGIDTAQFAEDVNWLNNTIINGQNFNDIEIGANLNDEGFLNELSNMVNAAGMTASQATDYLASMGVDAEVQEVKSESDETKTQTGWESELVPETRVGSVPIVSSNGTETSVSSMPIVYTTYSSRYTPTTDSITDTKENSAFSLKVTSAHKSSGGNFKFSQAKSGGGSAGQARRSTPAKKSGGGGKKKSGGGGGGSSKVKEPDKMDSLDKDTNRYHDIDLTIKGLETDFDRLGDQEKKLFGKDLINNLNKQLDILEKQKEAYEDKIVLAQQEAKELRGTLAAQGVQFGADGYISNYASALQAKLDYTNSVIAKYNSMTAEEQEAFKETVEQAKEDYEEFQKQIESYDKLISDTIPGLQDDIQDAIDKQIEIQIEKFTMEVEIRLDMSEAERDFNEFRRKVIDGIKDDDILGNATSNLKDLLSYFNTNNTGTGPIQSLTEQVNDTIQQIEQINNNGQASAYGDNKAQALEDLKEYYEELMDQLEDVEDLVDEIKESYLDMIDEAIDKFDKQVDQYEYINDIISHDMNVIGLLYGDDAYAEMSRYYQQIEENNNKELDFLRQRVQYAYDMMQAETDPAAREKWQEEWEDSLAELNDKVEDSIENIIDKYSNSINEVFSKLNNKLTNGLGLDYVGEEWDLINKNADQYLDTINGMFAIQDLENRYLDALDAEDSIAGQKKLNDLMNQQLGMLREKDKLTQYDVDRANMLFEIALKEIALQNAQQNKTQMRLRRDAQGNYSYQFVSDQENIIEAQRELAQAQNDLYNLDKNKYRENLNDIYDIYSEFQSKLLELYQDQTLSVEEREKREALLVEQYSELINGLVEQNTEIRKNLYQSTFDSLANMYDADLKNFANLSQEEQNILMSYLTNFSNLSQEEQNILMEYLANFSNLTQEQQDLLIGYLSNFSNLTEEEQNLLMGYLVNFSNLTQEEQDLLMDCLSIFSNSAQEEQNVLMKFFSNFANLSQEEQDLLASYLSNFSNLTKEEQDDLMRYISNCTNLTKEEQDILMGYLANLTEEQQKLLVNSLLSFTDLTQEQQELLMSNLSNFTNLTQEQQGLLMSYLSSFSSLAQEEQNILMSYLSSFSDLTKGEQESLINYLSSFSDLTKTEQDLLMDYLSSFTNLTQEQQGLLMGALASFTDLTEQEKDLLMNSLIPQWDSGVQHMADVFAGSGGFIPTCEEAFASLKDTTADYQASLSELERAAGINFDTIANGYDRNIERIQDLLIANDDLINNYMKQIEAIQQVIAQVESLIDSYAQVKSAAEDAAQAAYELWQQEQNRAAEAANKDKQASNPAPAQTTPAPKPVSTPAPAKSSSGGDGVPNIGDVVTYIGGYYYYDSYGTRPTGKRGPGKKVTITHLNPGAPYPIHVESNDSAYGWLRQDQISGYDTGGYTGEWGSNGRIGILHQKELVLNASDTENILSAVELVREVSSLANGLNQSMLNRLAGMTIGVVNNNIPFDKESNKVDQNVHIQAEFPNVRDSREIEDALNNLVNIASQHAFNNKR